METKDIKQSIKLGIFVLVALALFLISIFYVGSQNNIFNRTSTVSAVFKNVEGLKPGDNVWLSGVKIGTVKDVRIISEGKVIVDLSLKDKQSNFIKKDATASIGSDGLVGSKIVVINPGTANRIIEDQDTINALSPTDTQELLNIAKDVGQNTRSLSNDLKLIAQKINKGQGIVGELLNEGVLAQDLRQAVVSLKNTGANAVQATAQLHALVYEVRNGDGLLPTLIQDTSYERVFSEALANVKQVSEHSASMAKELEIVLAKVNDRNNALGVILADTTFANKLQDTMDNAQEASAKLDENMEALQHNFLLRGYFRRKARDEERAAKEMTSASKNIKGG